MVQVEPLAAKHAFIHWIVGAAFYRYTALLVLVDSDPAAYAAIAAGGRKTFRMTRVDRHKYSK
jgi:hypothetical protein